MLTLRQLINIKIVRPLLLFFALTIAICLSIVLYFNYKYTVLVLSLTQQEINSTSISVDQLTSWSHALNSLRDILKRNALSRIQIEGIGIYTQNRYGVVDRFLNRCTTFDIRGGASKVTACASYLNNHLSAYVMATMVMLLACIIFVEYAARNSSDKLLVSVETFLDSLLKDKKKGGLEKRMFIREFVDLEKKIESYKCLLKERQHEVIKLEVMAQVAHDIRSPLSALEMMVSSLDELSEDKRVIIRNAANRIRDIANSLASQKKKAEGQLEANENSAELYSRELFSEVLLLPIIDSVITEKRIQYRSQPNTVIEFNQTRESYGLFISVQVNEFKRVISNLLNNAIESLNNSSGLVQVILNVAQNQKIEINIIDTGCGIPEGQLNKIGERGATFNKVSGTGLGLYHAKKFIEYWKGELIIQSKVGSGTTVRVVLPRVIEPKWFVSAIKIKDVLNIVVFDDDQSIHQIWQSRIKQEVPQDINLNMIHIFTSFEFRKYFQNHFDDLEKSIFLVDYEILSEQESGLQLIEELGIQKQSILVTSRYDEAYVRTHCARLGVKLIPKPMAGFVPIHFCTPKNT